MDKPNTNPPSSDQEKAGIVGTVTEALPNTLFRVQLAGENEVLAYLAGKMRLNRIRVLIGDKVELILSPDGLKGRIIRRF